MPVILMLLSLWGSNAAASSLNENDPFERRFFKDEATSDIAMPILSLFLPGLDQFVKGQIEYAAVYSGTALAGTIYALNTAQDLPPDFRSTSLESKNVAARKYLFGEQIAQAAGGLSLYHSFRTAVASRKPLGQYDFLTMNETPAEILRAPLELAYLTRRTTWLPLLIGAAINCWELSHPSDGNVFDRFTSIDAAFTAGYAYNAGTHEEAVFRGWLMPVMREYGISDTWSNVSQAAIFALAHTNNTAVPVVQALLGYHLGAVTQINHWTIGESIFIHTWWDVMAFATQYHLRRQELALNPTIVPRHTPASLTAPPLHWSF